jgi:filamentous hemagglutinin
VSYKRGEILDDKPVGRPIAKDRQEIIRFINAYRQRTGSLPERIIIERYDPNTGALAGRETYSPSDFLPP